MQNLLLQFNTLPYCYTIKLKEHLEMDIAHIIRSHLRFDLIEMYLLKKAKIEIYLRLDWSNNCGEFFRRELVKSI